VHVLTVRPARAEDEAALSPIDRATWTADVSPVAPPRPPEPLLDVATLSDVLVAEVDGAVLGYIRLTQPGPLPSHAHVLSIDGLAVDPARQGEGMGRALVVAAVEEARRRGARKVALRVLAPNAPARRLYESCGFSVEGVLREEFLLNGKYVDDLLMACFLHDSGAAGA
jgi:ribosomal protein S18 acetylase RimI-like enzyme